MKTNRTTSLTFVLALLVSQQTLAGPMHPLQNMPEAEQIIQVEADCYALGQDKAAELGGELAKASPDTVDGVPVCHVVVLVPGKDGARPQRVSMDIPQ
jgi:hypothetical protein